MGELLEVLPLANIREALVRSIDSSPPGPILSRYFGYPLPSIGDEESIVSLLELEAAVTRRIFTGFDEVWLFTQKIEVPPSPEWCLVAPLNLSGSQAMKACEWMQSHGCLAAFGDGEGLNALILPQATAILDCIKQILPFAESRSIE